VDTCTVVAWS